jgi:hypothetical protein
VIVTSTIRTSSGGITEQEKITIEETKAKMKFREILFNELQVLSKLGSGQLGTVYLVRSLCIAVCRSQSRPLTRGVAPHRRLDGEARWSR